MTAGREFLAVAAVAGDREQRCGGDVDVHRPTEAGAGEGWLWEGHGVCPVFLGEDLRGGVGLPAEKSVARVLLGGYGVCAACTPKARAS